MPDYTQCQICGHTIPQGHPCLQCVKKNRIKETDTVITPEKIMNFVSILRLEKHDTVVIKSNELLNEEDSIHNMAEYFSKVEPFKSLDINLIILSESSDVMIIRKSDDK